MVQATTSPRTGESTERISYEHFLDLSTDEHLEWVDGRVVKMGEVNLAHARLTAFLLHLFRSFVEATGLGEILAEPFNMKLAAAASGRCPDIMFVSVANRERLREKHLDGPADLVVEVISPSTRNVDRGEKFYEYETGGVPELWLIDPRRQVAEFYRLDERGHYEPVLPAGGIYESAALPGFSLAVDWLWTLPPVATIAAKAGITTVAG